MINPKLLDFYSSSSSESDQWHASRLYPILFIFVQNSMVWKLCIMFCSSEIHRRKVARNSIDRSVRTKFNFQVPLDKQYRALEIRLPNTIVEFDDVNNRISRVPRVFPPCCSKERNKGGPESPEISARSERNKGGAEGGRPVEPY